MADRYDVTITPRELRALLYDIDNQNMTIAELRNLLNRLPKPEYNAPLDVYGSMADTVNTLDKKFGGK